MKWGWLGAGVLTLTQVCLAQDSITKTTIPYAEARALVETLKKDALPPELVEVPAAQIDQTWRDWLARQDEDIRARVESGDEDSVINLLLFGTTFTKQPRVTERDLANLAKDPARAATAFAERLADLVAGISDPQGNERLEFARRVVTRKGVDLASSEGRAKAGDYLRRSLERVATEVALYDRAIQMAERDVDPSVAFLEQSTLFRGRGLSSDTSLFTDHAIDRALAAIRASKTLPPGAVHRVAVVGPGLDFTDKHEGFDFYPPQTIQPFALIDSLVRHGLSTTADLQVVTLDISSRITHHLEVARQEALEHAYVLQLPRELNSSWHPDLDNFWTRFGEHIGEAIAPIPPPAAAGAIKSRAVRIQPSVLRAISPYDLNIVTERLNTAARFDLIVATNILIYYDTFRQSLALLNIASMLRPGGLLIVNGRLFVLPSIPLDLDGQLDVIYTYRPETGEVGDKISWFRRRK